MKADLSTLVLCPSCDGSLTESEGEMRCDKCENTLTRLQGTLILSPSPDDIVLIEQNEESGEVTFWRQQNQIFLEELARNFNSRQVVLDVGAGPGYFSSVFRDNLYASVDFYPWKGLDVVCNLTERWPIRDSSVDLIVIANVLEHMFQPKRLISDIHKSLKADGTLAITVPFLIKIHQAPYDYGRYTHFALRQILVEAGFENVEIEAVYDPQSLANTMLNNLYSSVPRGRNLRHRISRRFIQIALRIINSRLLSGYSYEPFGLEKDLGTDSNPFPIGYHVLCKKVKSL